MRADCRREDAGHVIESDQANDSDHSQSTICEFNFFLPLGLDPPNNFALNNFELNHNEQQII